VAVIRCEIGEGLIGEEVWEDSERSAVRYNLAFINSALFSKDNGRVLGYDTAHGTAHRHFAGVVEPIEHFDYADILERFISEVSELRTRKVL
jgi:hypothetical protein